MTRLLQRLLLTERILRYRAQLRRREHCPLRVELQEVDAIPAGASGKRPLVVAFKPTMAGWAGAEGL